MQNASILQDIIKWKSLKEEVSQSCNENIEDLFNANTFAVSNMFAFVFGNLELELSCKVSIFCNPISTLVF